MVVSGKKKGCLIQGDTEVHIKCWKILNFTPKKRELFVHRHSPDH